MNETHGCEGSERKQEALLPDVPPSTEVAQRPTAGPTRLCRAAISQFKMSHREIKTPLVSCGLGDKNTVVVFFPFLFLSAGFTESRSVPCDYSVTPGGICVLLRDKGPSMEQNGPNRGAFLSAAPASTPHLPISPKSRVKQQQGPRHRVAPITEYTFSRLHLHNLHHSLLHAHAPFPHLAF